MQGASGRRAHRSTWRMARSSDGSSPVLVAPWVHPLTHTIFTVWHGAPHTPSPCVRTCMYTQGARCGVWVVCLFSCVSKVDRQASRRLESRRAGYFPLRNTHFFFPHPILASFSVSSRNSNVYCTDGRKRGRKGGGGWGVLDSMLGRGGGGWKRASGVEVSVGEGCHTAWRGRLARRRL